jgi:hypothetical protein
MLPSEKTPRPKPNPIETEPHYAGNLVIDRERKLYRFATDEEKEFAAIYGKNLYRSHFAACPARKEFRRK